MRIKKKSTRLLLMLRGGAPGQTEKMTQPEKERVPAFTEALQLSFNSKPFFHLHSPYSSGIDNLRKVHFLSTVCGCVSHCLVPWTSVDFFLYIVGQHGSFPIRPSAAPPTLHACQLVTSFLS